ncbi:hypothetical protein AB6A40_005905 [Gnathostoma spinigerum]|uniref:Uncharacterized protein n=1 Tax=Gnathostoma spinigerum TaxID=75299 RepID=A0ABD6EP38_9BILA
MTSQLGSDHAKVMCSKRIKILPRLALQRCVRIRLVDIKGDTCTDRADLQRRGLNILYAPLKDSFVTSNVFAKSSDTDEDVQSIFRLLITCETFDGPSLLRDNIVLR